MRCWLVEAHAAVLPARRPLLSCAHAAAHAPLHARRCCNSAARQHSLAQPNLFAAHAKPAAPPLRGIAANGAPQLAAAGVAPAVHLALRRRAGGGGRGCGRRGAGRCVLLRLLLVRCCVTDLTAARARRPGGCQGCGGAHRARAVPGASAATNPKPSTETRRGARADCSAALCCAPRAGRACTAAGRQHTAAAAGLLRREPR